MALEERFWSKVYITEPDTCWEWQGALSSNEYGSFAVSTSIKKSSHVVAYELFYGPIPKSLEKMDVMHSCDNRLCCNPMHLSLGTRKQNLDDMRAKGRANDFGGVKPDNRGEKQGRATLSDYQAYEVYLLKDSGLTQTFVASLFNVDRRTIGRVWRRQTWKHLHQEESLQL